MVGEKQKTPRKHIRILNIILVLAAILLCLFANPDFSEKSSYDAKAKYIAERIGQEEMIRYVNGKSFTDDLSKIFVIDHFKNHFPHIRTVFHFVDDDRFSLSVFHLKSESGQVYTVQSPDPLFLATIKGDTKKAKRLIEQGTNIDTEYDGRSFAGEDRWGFCTTSLNCAACYGHTEIARLLITRQAKRKPYSYDNMSILQVAVHYGHLALVKYLLEEGEDFNTNPSLVYLAADAGHGELVKLLLGLGIDPDSKTTKNETALSVAIKNDHPEIVRDLLAAGADPSQGLKAAIEKKNLELTKELIEKGAKVDGPGFPLYAAAANGAVEIAELLLAHDATIDQKSEIGNTALFFAAGQKSLDMVQFLVAKGADVNSVNRFGDTPLARAATEGNLDIIKFLVDSGAKVDTAPRTNTPLHRAIRGGHTAVARYLVKKGADINAKNVAGIRPLRAAVLAHEWKTAFLLFHRGASYR